MVIFNILCFLGAPKHRVHYQYMTIFAFTFFYIKFTNLNHGEYILIHTKDARSFSLEVKSILGVPYDTKNMLR